MNRPQAGLPCTMHRMRIPSRRNFLAAFTSAIAVLAKGMVVRNVFAAQPAASQDRQPATATPTAGGGTLGPARAIPFDSVTATGTANGGDRRVMLRGSLETGEKVELHQSTQMPGTPAPALHVVRHSEMILVREGTLKFDHEVDGKVLSETVGPGGVFYVAYGTKHAASNVGSTPARYFVVQIGGDVK
jgi:mannose-6-phosphate isomerase-like protein (cupin superfamily)